MLIIQIIGGWLAVSSICLNVYYFLTLGYQRKLNQEYRELLHHADNRLTEQSIEIRHLHDRQKDAQNQIVQIQYDVNQLKNDR